MDMPVRPGAWFESHVRSLGRLPLLCPEELQKVHLTNELTWRSDVSLARPAPSDLHFCASY